MGRFFLNKEENSEEKMNPDLKKYLSLSMKKVKWKTASEKDIKLKQHQVYVDRFSI